MGEGDQSGVDGGRDIKVEYMGRKYWIIKVRKNEKRLNVFPYFFN